MDRQDILKRILYPKCKSALEFQFDTMIVNPLLSYITVQDIYQLNKIATSLKYSSKPKEKYAMINQIMEARGFRKMASGTNRVVYRCLNDYRIVLKIAIDRVGLSDNGNEYRVQHLLKPFVTKCFEVSPCGTVGIFERVVPITSREEFVNISDDIFDLINNLVGKYVLEDIGEKFYMNYGLREGFGPVLLDYPYVFELDGRKLICNVQDPTTGNFCRGEIDYDIGYNNLICTKCGKRYLATELKSEEKSDKPKIIIKGEDFMKCVLKRGNEVVNELNSKSTFGTNTIKPKKEFTNLKCRVSRPVEEKKEEPYRTNIIEKDDVTLQVRLRGVPSEKNKAVDREALRKEEIAKRTAETIPVSFNSEELITPEKEDTMEVKIHRSDESNIKPTDLMNSVYGMISEDFKFDKGISDPELFMAKIIDGEIWNMDKGEVIGYSFDHEVLKKDNEEPDKNPDFSEEDAKNLLELDRRLKTGEITIEDHLTKLAEDSKKDQEEDPITATTKIAEADTINKNMTQISTESISGYKTNQITTPVANHFSAPEVKEEEKVEEETVNDYDDTVGEDEYDDNYDEEAETDSDDEDDVEIPEVVIHSREESDQLSLY